MFLQKDYKIPASGGQYFKFQDGENNFRVLSSAIVGYEYWTEDNKPVRKKELPEQRPSDIRIEKDNSFRIKHFWAFVVWNYEDSAIQIMEITQKTIMSAIKALVDNDKWGDPKEFDITITKTGEGLETKYAVMPNPKSKLEEEITNQYVKKNVNLEMLFSGLDPFSSEETLTKEQIEDDR